MPSGVTRTVTVNVVGDATGLTRTLGSAASTSESTGSRISKAFRSSFSTIAAASGGAFGPIQDVLSGLNISLDGVSFKLKDAGKSMLTLGAAGAGAGAALTAFGSADQAAQQQLAAAFQATGHSISDYKGQIDKTVSSMARYGYTSNQTENALQTLVSATGNPTEAIGLMGDAANLAAAKHENLTEATQQLAQILAGKGLRTLQTFGITQEQVKATGADHLAILNLLANKLQGQASAAADTATGHFRAWRAEIEDQVAVFGAKYGPSITAAGVGISALGTVVEGVTAIVRKFSAGEELSKGATEAATGAEALQTAAEGVQTAATTADAAATTALDVAEGVALAPVLAIIAAVVALGVGVYELVTHWSTCWNAIKETALAAWHFIDDYFVQPTEQFFAGIVGFIEQHWQGILEILTGPIGLAVTFITDHFWEIVNFVSALPGELSSAASGLWDWVYNGLEEVVDDVAAIWNETVGQLSFRIPSWVPGVGGDGFSMPKIPHFAEGGIVTRPTIALIGENGPEMVIPMGGMGAYGALPPASTPASFGASDGTGGTLEIPVSLEIDGQTFANATYKYTYAQLLRTRQNRSKTGLG